MAAPFTIHGSNERGTAHVHLTGELDLASKETLRSTVRTHLDDDAVNAVMIDLTDLTFIDSTGIGALIGCLRMADGTGKSVRAGGAHGRVADVLTITGVMAILAGPDPVDAAPLPDARSRD